MNFLDLKEKIVKMKHLGKDITVDISINTVKRTPKSFLTEHFSEDKISEIYDPLDGGSWMTLISNVDIARKDFYKFMFDLINVQDCFNINIDSEQINLNECYNHVSGNDFITRRYVPDEFCNKSGIIHLFGILFHGKEEKIKLEDLK